MSSINTELDCYDDSEAKYKDNKRKLVAMKLEKECILYRFESRKNNKLVVDKELDNLYNGPNPFINYISDEKYKENKRRLVAIQLKKLKELKE